MGCDLEVQARQTLSSLKLLLVEVFYHTTEKEGGQLAKLLYYSNRKQIKKPVIVYHLTFSFPQT